MPGTLAATAPAERGRSRYSLIFLVVSHSLRRVVMTSSLTVGKIILTVVSAGRWHGAARTVRGPEGDGAARVAVPEPASRAGHRRGVPFRGVLRRPRRGAGQVRD